MILGKKTISMFNWIQILSLVIIIVTSHTRQIKDPVRISEIQGPFTESEYKEIHEEAKAVVDFLVNTTLNNATMSNSLQSQMSKDENPNHRDNFICRTCLWTFTKFHQLMEKKYGLTLFNEFLTLLCSTSLDKNICSKAIDLYSSIIIDSIIEHYLDAEFICTKSYICRNEHYVTLDPDVYARELLKDKPVPTKLTVDASASTLKGTIGLCPDPLCCQAGNGMAKNSAEYAGRWGFQGNCDIPLRTLDLFIETVVNEVKPDIIVWTGDNAPHNPWLDNSDEIFNVTNVFIDLLYNKYGFKGPVFPALGNHEEYIADQYNPYDLSREKEFLKNMGDLFKNWLSESEYQEFITNGYYTAKYKETNLRIIAINCFLCDVMNFFLIRNPTDPGNQFSWLETTLRKAEKDGEMVYIIGHIPPGDSTYLSECSKRYNALIDRFSNIIRGQFYGHTHYDEFRLISEYFNPTNVAGLILTAPSLTTYSFKNPSFRVYEADSNTKLIKDYKQYRLNLTEANLTPDIKPQFKLAYSAKEKFNFKHLNDFLPFKESIEKILTDKDWFNFTLDTFYAQGVEKNSYINNKKIGNYLSCRFKASVFDDYFKCTGYRTWDYVEYVNRFIEIFSGKWYVKVKDYEHKEDKFLK